MTCSGEILNVEVINKTVFLNFIIKIFLNKDKIEIFIMFIKKIIIIITIIVLTMIITISANQDHKTN